MTSSILLQPSAALAAYATLTGGKLEILNPWGRQIADIFVPNEGGGGILDLYGEDAKLRVQVGSYSSGGEKGQPLIGLFDNNAHLRMLARLAGGNESPVLIFKDKSGRDRMVMGLGMSGADQEPFLSIVDKDGKKRNIFGNY